MQAGARQPVGKVQRGCNGRSMRILRIGHSIHDLFSDRHPAVIEPRKKSRRTGPKVIFTPLVEMRLSDRMALQTGFCMGHGRRIPVSLRQCLGPASWEATVPDEVYEMEK